VNTQYAKKGGSIANGIAPVSAWWRLIFLLLTLIVAHSSEAKNDLLQSTARFGEATEQFRRGAFDGAVVLWRQVAEDVGNSAALRLHAYLGIAAACQKMGLYQEALQSLSNARPLLKKIGDVSLAGQYYQQLGNLYLANHQHVQSLEAFVEAIAKAKQTGSAKLQAAVLNDYGNALNVSGYASDALAAHQQSLMLAREHSLAQLALNTKINIARLQLQRDDTNAAREALGDAEELLSTIQPSYEWAMTLLVLTDLERTLAPTTSDAAAVANARQRITKLQQAQAYADDAHNVRLLSLVYGYEGADLLSLGDIAQAEELTRKAIFQAAQIQANDVLYQWYWQLAKLLQKQGNLVAALEMFDKALAILTPIRQELLNGYHDSHLFFQQQIKPVYLDFVDALLLSADGLADGAAQRTALDKARDIVEGLKSAELQDYFRDECVVAQERKAMTLEQIAPGTAVLYPIVLAGRIELLLSINGEIYRRSVAVDQSQLLENALRLREFVQDPSSLRFMPYASRLYHWLIEPVKQQLVAAGIDTLIVIPDGVLRTIPFAALHSGERFLVEEFALAVTPSLKLTAGPHLKSSQATALLAGIAQSVQGFSPLPKVSTELSAIHERVGGKVLSNREYTKANLKAALAAGDYNIVHMATHSTVGATPADSFLLTYDGKLTMGDLEYLLRIGEFREHPLELLTLSACETAIGDERAALGLAGIAVKSGAKSVLASLWLVDDNATALLMNRFYTNISLRDEGHFSKAKALRAAQLNLLSDPATEHPANWAAFMLIGNWL